MKYWAEIDADGVVLRVTVADDVDGYVWLMEWLGGTWRETSVDGSLRKNYAGIGFVYDSARDAFISPTPYPSWVLDEATCLWLAPTPMPDDNADYVWNEQAGDWEAV